MSKDKPLVRSWEPECPNMRRLYEMIEEIHSALPDLARESDLDEIPRHDQAWTPAPWDCDGCGKTEATNNKRYCKPCAGDGLNYKQWYSSLIEELTALLHEIKPDGTSMPDGRTDYPPGTDCCWSTRFSIATDLSAILLKAWSKYEV